MKRPAQITGHQIDRHGGQHQNHAEPDAPVAMGAFPIRSMAMAMVEFRAIGIFKPVVFFLDRVVHIFLTFRQPLPRPGDVGVIEALQFYFRE